MIGSCGYTLRPMTMTKQSKPKNVKAGPIYTAATADRHLRTAAKKAGVEAA